MVKGILNEQLQREFKEGLEIVAKAGYPEVKNIHYIVTLNPRLKTTLGWCARTVTGGKKGFEIEINQSYYAKVPKEVRMNTIVHEICHSVPYCDSDHHGPKWKAVAAKASKFLEIPITRTASQQEEKYLAVKEALAVADAKYLVECNECHWSRPYFKASKLIAIKQSGGMVNGRFVCPICKKSNWKVMMYGKEI